MTSKSKVNRVRWMAGLTLALLFLSLLMPFFLRLLPPTLPNVEPTFEPLSPEWKGAIDFIFIILACLFNACYFVFFVRLLRGINKGKMFVPGNARWLYVGAWVPIVTLLYRFLCMFLIQGGSGLAVAIVICAQLWKGLAIFFGITLMALLYDMATDVSEENQLTV